VVAVDDEVCTKSVQRLLNALMGVGVGDLEHSGQRGRRRWDEDAPAAEDEALVDSPWGATGLGDGVAEAAQVGVILQLGAKVVVEAERRTRERRELGLANLHPGKGVGDGVHAPGSVLDGEVETEKFADPLVLRDRR
jgi:hypothetical protein